MIPKCTNQTHTNHGPECVRVWPGDRGGEWAATTKPLVESCPITAEAELSDGQTAQWAARRRSCGGGFPGPLAAAGRAGDSCPEWRRRSQSRGRGQRLSDGPRRRPQLLTGEGAEPGLEGPGRGASRVAKPGVLVSGCRDTEGPSALPPRGCGGSGSARCSVSATLLQGAARV